MPKPGEYKIGSFLLRKGTKDVYKITHFRFYKNNSTSYKYFYDLRNIRTDKLNELNPIYLLDDYYTLLNVDENTIKILYGTN